MVELFVIHREELKPVRGNSFIKGILISFNMVSRVAIFVSLVSYVYCGNVFTARQVFIVTTYFNFLYNSMLHNWPMSLTSLAESYVSIKRIQVFLMEPESKFAACAKDEVLPESTILLNKSSRNNLQIVDNLNASMKSIGSTMRLQVECQKRIQVNKPNDRSSVVFESVTALWPGHDDSISIGNYRNRLTRLCLYTFDGIDFFFVGIKNINLTMNSLTVIIGSVGAGKSTLLQTILGELEVDDGQLRINGAISYAAQEPWLFEANIQQNILFTELYDEKRYVLEINMLGSTTNFFFYCHSFYVRSYNEVIRVCALERDLEILPHGDYTIVGERGISLSGGQRARINLARAIYRQADIYLLDDPLSAVDTHVGKHIFENCVRGFLKVNHTHPKRMKSPPINNS